MSEITERLTTAIADRYRIERHLGEGGMATVYLAHDVKHDRKVALKVLRPELAAVIGAERFLQEIKVTANLQHPHILPLHDSGEAGAFLYYVMPYVEGDTLRDKLDREKQLGIEDAVGITCGVAAALDYAHRQDVIHRDIKPENILIHDGQALVADFGIALAVSEAGASRLTETGLSIGTPHYMSPEQAMGDRELDARSDVYSLGAMLYEMLAGDPPYQGSTAQAIVAKVITEKAPPVTAVRDTVPSHVAAAIQKALSKLPADRFHTAAEFADALARPTHVQVPGAAVPATDVRPRRTPRTFSERQVLAVAAIGVIAAVAAVWGWVRRPPQPLLTRFSVALPAEQMLETAHNGHSIVFSPDGTLFVYVGRGRQLFVRTLGQLDARLLPGTDGARAPFFSPDGEWVAFLGDGNQIKKVALSGGPPLTITDANTAMRGGTWGPNGTIVFAPSTATGLFEVSSSGGEATQITTPDTSIGITSHRWPSFLPDGNAVVFTVFSGTQEESSLAVYSFETGEVIDLAVRGFGAHYSSTGHLVYVTYDGALIALPFDAKAVEATGPPVSLLEGVLVRATLAPEFTFSRDGAFAYVSGLPSERSLELVDRAGISRPLTEKLQLPRAPRFAPDGERVALELQEGGNLDVWVYNMEQATMTRLTFEGNNRYPVWSPDGTRIGFSSGRDGATVRDLYSKPADGSGVAERLHDAPGELWETLYVPDGRSLVVRRTAPGPTGRDIWIVPLEPADSARPFLVTQFNERSAAISPDGRWLAYVSDESGQDEVYVRPLPGPGGKRQVSVEGGTEPRWSSDGSELFYRSLTHVVAAPIRTVPALSIGARQDLFEDDYVRNLDHTNYDIHPVTGEFLMISGSDEATELILVLNWFEELRSRTER